MTWDEINKKYENSGHTAENRCAASPSLNENWKKLMKSMDKLLWLFIISDKEIKEKVKTVSD